MNKRKTKKYFKTDDEIKLVLDKLEAEYPDADCALHYDSIFHLLLAVVLSAQTTDASVNKITPRLFSTYENPGQLAAADIKDVEGLIKTLGLYKNKAKSLVGIGNMLTESYEGEVPRDFSELQKLPGVGRKTANVVRSVAFGYPAIAVDTHVFRVSNRLKLSVGDTPDQVEEGLKKVIPMRNWSNAHHWLIWHGRRVCHARRPSCETCFLADVCPSCSVKVEAWKPRK